MTPNPNPEVKEGEEVSKYCISGMPKKIIPTLKVLAKAERRSLSAFIVTKLVDVAVTANPALANTSAQSAH